MSVLDWSSSAASGGPTQRVDVVLVGEIKVRFEVCDHVEQMIAKCDDRSGKPTSKLLECGVELRGVARFDHAQNRLGPRQVDPAQRKARSVNSPGSAWRAPRTKQ